MGEWVSTTPSALPAWPCQPTLIVGLLGQPYFHLFSQPGLGLLQCCGFPYTTGDRWTPGFREQDKCPSSPLSVPAVKVRPTQHSDGGRTERGREEWVRIWKGQSQDAKGRRIRRLFQKALVSCCFPSTYFQSVRGFSLYHVLISLLSLNTMSPLDCLSIPDAPPPAPSC